jgi:sporulation protein YlmC with PRC-barrel domain
MVLAVLRPTLLERLHFEGNDMGYTDRDKYGIYRHTGKNGPGPALMGADTLLGEHVVNGAEESLGEIKEIMLDMASGRVAYAVLAFGGFLGMHEKLFAVPWQALQLDNAHHRFVLNVEKERLKTAPGFNKDAWPDMSDVAWASEVHTFYGTDPLKGGAMNMVPGVGMRTGMSEGGGAGIGSGMAGHAGGSVDPRPGNLGDDKDGSRIRGSNIG